MTTALITGGAGFLGHHCIEYWLEKTDWRIVAVDIEWPYPPVPYARHPRFNLIHADLTGQVWPLLDSAALVRDGLTPDIIVNAASQSHVDTSITDPVGTWWNNTSLVLSVLEFARKCKPKLFVQTSTDEVYGPCSLQRHGKHFTGFREWNAIIPSNPYSASKAAQEALAISYWRTYGVPVVLTNCVNMFGERQHEEKFIPKIIKALKAGETVQVHADKHGVIGSRWWTYAKNYADLVVWLYDRKVTMFADGHTRPNRWNLAGQERLSNLEMVRRVAKIMGVEPRYTIIDADTARPGHDQNYGLDGTALELAGWKPPFSVADSLERTVKALTGK